MILCGMIPRVRGREVTFYIRTGVLAFLREAASSNIRISMDGKGRRVDNVFVERLWRSVKYEEVYLKGYNNIRGARASLLPDPPNCVDRRRVHLRRLNRTREGAQRQ